MMCRSQFVGHCRSQVWKKEEGGRWLMVWVDALGIFYHCPTDGYYSNQGYDYSSAYSNDPIHLNQPQGYGSAASGSHSSYADPYVALNIYEYVGDPIRGYLVSCTEQEDYEGHIQHYTT